MQDPERKKSFLSIFEGLSKEIEEHTGHNGHPYGEADGGDEEFDELRDELTDEMDHLILMQRDAHFGGDFELMQSYYDDEANVGILPEIDPERIAYLAEVENEMGNDLAAVLLTGAEAEKVASARKAYSNLKELYETEEPNSPLLLIADLILSEEDEPQQEINAVVERGKEMLPHLFAILKSDELYDSLFPGYGYAPYLAALCIGNIQDPSGIIPLFEAIGKETIFDELALVDALAEIGPPARDFLLQILKGRPLTHDHANAAFALSAFMHDPQVALTCFEQLQDPQIQDKPLLTMYLVNNCELLGKMPEKEAFIKLATDPSLPPDLRSQMALLIDEWKHASH